jgi:hypothetical protein
MAKTYEEKITETKQKIEQEQNRIKRLIQERKAVERKARTRRLIERGAIVESLIDGVEGMTNEQIKALLQTALPRAAAKETPKTAQGERA